MPAENDGIPMAPPTYNSVINGDGQPRKLELSIWHKLAELSELVGDYIQKDGKNAAQKYNYVSEGKVLSKVKPALHEARLIGIPNFELVSCEDKSTSNGAIWKLATVKCTLAIYDIDSTEHVNVTALGQGIDPNDKAVAKAQTQAFKYAWWKLLCLETGDDPEADPNTDEQQFGAGQPSPAAPAAYSQSQTYNPWTPLTELWQRSGFPIVDLQEYMLRRFPHPSAADILPSEINLVCAELQAQLRAKGVQI
ncbi:MULTISPECIES: ERF family protein [Cloacibacillus]|uniref:ERF family protein n=1 Tax=Cloacibacillus TaxID=508459 RepID=UPI002109EA67|nr:MULTISPECIES: ERF family protein [Cloacibacillus]MCC8184989.1 ERF family protein [Cloacibacillus porcorum]MCQ4763248.1 ERF family protein [Cloacibacillus evryensis]